MEERTTTGSLRLLRHEVDPCSAIRLDGPTLIVTGAYCPSGHDMIDAAGPRFAGYPGIRLRVRHGAGVSDVVLSPIHGDHSKQFSHDLPPGTRCGLECPVCGCPLPVLAKCNCREGGDLVAIYLSPKLDRGTYAAVCNIWGCHRSRVVDGFDLVSEFIEEEG